jgi:cytochrome bd ubiquinol oxidase subunit II
VRGLNEFPREAWPDNIPLLYYSYHIMVGLGTLFIAVMALSGFCLWRRQWQQFGSQPWGMVFPALTGLVGVRVLGTQRQDRGAFLASSLYLAGMLASMAFGVFPNVLPSNTTPELSLTIDNAAAAEHGLVIGLWWFIPGMALAIAYAVYTYRHVAGKVE